ncbi:HigA family addiction module antitoxin [Paraburkholderia unamae]|uniref:Addiction module HigA family antidote n=1 Tax=Paraburkholderia unamae TaxID=219649 RepID=A0ABX5K732_9BURK|nr:HigA family addiction module antitoxin [Paraburkholderia unamae]PVX61353.1 addiction module HigA family antidote [Paraburkholderia unamae]RAR49281.1 addiction module HigA family antidote [Paraburkholderia unamae]
MRSATAPTDTTLATPHPGLFLRAHVLPAMNLSVSQAARDLRISRQTLHRILEGATAITPAMAVRLERLSGLPSMFWLCRQCEYDLCTARAALAEVLTQIPLRTLSPKLLKQLGVHDGR